MQRVGRTLIAERLVSRIVARDGSKCCMYIYIIYICISVTLSECN